MHYELAANATLLFLILFFFFVEVWQWKKKKEGIIEEFVTASSPLKDMAGIGAKVRLVNGDLVKATVSPCNLCLGRLEVGDKVNLVKIKDVYAIKLSLLPRRKENAGFYPL